MIDEHRSSPSYKICSCDCEVFGSLDCVLSSEYSLFVIVGELREIVALVRSIFPTLCSRPTECMGRIP